METTKTFEGREMRTYSTDGETVVCVQINKRRGPRTHSFEDDGTWARRIEKAGHVLDLMDQDPVFQAAMNGE